MESQALTCSMKPTASPVLSGIHAPEMVKQHGAQTPSFLLTPLPWIYCLPQVTALNHAMNPCLSKGMSKARSASFLSWKFITFTPSLTRSSDLGTVLRWTYWKMGGIPSPSLHSQLQSWLPFVSSDPFSSALAQPVMNFGV